MTDYIKIDQMRHNVGKKIELKGWLYNSRSGGKVLFLVLRDGTGLCQAVFEKSEANSDLFARVKHLGQESAITLVGTVREEPRSVGGFELAVEDVNIIHETTDYPITPKSHGIDFLMKNRHLHLRSQRQWAIARIRHTIIDAIRTYFNSNGFTLVDTPIFSPSAGEEEQTLFNVDYFGEDVALAQTGQLYVETAAMSLGKVYCFGPTFRAEKSKTRRHLTEFWMVEPEICYIDLNDLMSVGEGLICSIIDASLANCKHELDILQRDLTDLEKIKPPFAQLSYREAVDMLHSSQVSEWMDSQFHEKNNEKQQLEEQISQWTAEQESAKKQWQKDKLSAQIIAANSQIAELTEQIENIPKHKELAQNFSYGKDLGGSDETIISMQFDTPVFVHRYPKEVKAFYMKPDPDDQSVVLNFDCLAPQGYGEIIGGSMREESYQALHDRIVQLGFDPDNYSWYLDLRKYGSVPHGGFGLGVERTVAWITGVKHIRECIAYPRMMGRVYP